MNKNQNDLLEALEEVRTLLNDAQKMVDDSTPIRPLPDRFEYFVERLALLARKLERVIANESRKVE